MSKSIKFFFHNKIYKKKHFAMHSRNFEQKNIIRSILSCYFSLSIKQLNQLLSFQFYFSKFSFKINEKISAETKQNTNEQTNSVETNIQNQLKRVEVRNVQQLNYQKLNK